MEYAVAQQHQPYRGDVVQKFNWKRAMKVRSRGISL
jgi:hypothetical protein